MTSDMAATLQEVWALVDEYRALPLRDRNYRSCMYANLLSYAVDDITRVGGRAVREASEGGQDRFAFEILELVRALIDGGSTDSQVVEAVQDATAARIEAGLPPEQWFTGGDGS